MTRAALVRTGKVLLHTKLHRPQSLPGTVARPRLWSLLEAGLDGSLILVTAPAGYGKTTLVSTWLAERTSHPARPMPSAWISLDESESDLDQFLRYLCAALDTIFPGACSGSLALLTGNPVPLREFVASLSNEISALPAEFILVLDDLHNLSGSIVPALLSELTQHWPDRLHMVLLSRYAPDLPLARLRARGQLCELTSEDLRFTPDEIDQFLQRAAPLPQPAPDLAERLESHTEGWAAGLRLATLSLRRHDWSRLTEPLTADANIADYLLQDVLTHEPPEIRSFLLHIALLDRWCLPVCRAVASELSEATAHACVDWLERSNFFIIALDDRREWYRFHRLLRDVLRRRAAEVFTPEQRVEQHRRAACWFEQNGWTEEALRHALATGDLDHAAYIVETGFMDVINREDRQTLERWLRHFPESLIAARPGLLLLKMSALQVAWRLPAMKAATDACAALLDAGSYAPTPLSGPIMRGVVAVARAHMAYQENRMDVSEACSREGLRLLPDAWTFFRGAAMIYRTVAGQALGRSATTDVQAADDYQSLAVKDDTYALRILLGLCMSAFLQGQLEQSAQIALVLEEKARLNKLHLMRGWAHYWLGCIALERGELVHAEGQFANMVELRYQAPAQAVRFGLIGLTLTCAALGHSDAAWKSLRLVGQHDIEILGAETLETHALRALLQYRRGETETAFLWAESDIGPVPNRAHLWIFSAHEIKAYLLTLRGGVSDLAAAQSVLSSLGAVAQQTNNTRMLIHVEVGHALAFWAQKQRGEALDHLSVAVKLAQPGGFIHVFVEHGAVMQHMLRQLTGRMKDASYAQRLLASLSGTHQPGPILRTEPPLEEPLTPRELDVLRLMRERKSDKEIASALGITVGTVKRHSANLFGKLGVNRRWEAVVRAEEYALL